MKMKKIKIFLILIALFGLGIGFGLSTSSSSVSSYVSASSSISIQVEAYACGDELKVDLSIRNPLDEARDLKLELEVDGVKTEREVTLQSKGEVNLNFSWQASEGSHTVSYRVLEGDRVLASGEQKVSVSGSGSESRESNQIEQASENHENHENHENGENHENENQAVVIGGESEQMQNFTEKLKVEEQKDLISIILDFFKGIIELFGFRR